MIDKKILEKIERRCELDEERNEEFAAFDRMVNMEYDFPAGLAGEDVVKFIDPGAHDAEKVACNIYDTYNPKWDILPRGPEDKDEAEKLERWLEWQMQRANTHGETEPFRQLMVHSLRYSMVAAQLDYLPYWLPAEKSEWTKHQKMAMQKGPFCVTIYHPSTVHYEMGAYGLRWVSTVAVVPAATVIDHWKAYESDTEEGKKIKAGLSKIEEMLADDGECKLTIVDYTDEHKRYVACWYCETDTPTFEVLEDADPDVIELVNAENKLPFINWAVSRGSSDALLTTLHKGHLWANVNNAETVKRDRAFKRAYTPDFIEEGVGEDVEVNYTPEVTTLQVPPGKRVTPNTPRPLEPAFNELSMQDRQLMASTTSTQNLANMGSGSNVQFATINAIIQINLTQLVSYKRTVEKCLQDLGMLAFQWIKFTGKTEKGYRTSTRSAVKLQGEQIDVGPDDFDPEALFITATLIPNTPTDRMQLVNMALQLKQAGFPIPDAEHMERLGYGNPDALAERWEDEQIQRMALKNFDAQQQAKLQLQMQEAQQQMQMQAQQALQSSLIPPQPGRPNPATNPQTPPVMPEGQGFNPAQGGQPPAEAAPQMTQTMIQNGG